MTGGDGCRLDEELFLGFTFNCNSRCANREGRLLFFQLLINVGPYKRNSIGSWKKNKTSFTVFIVII
ncbi:hypothetical protein COE24_07570 [Bacillus thuringiensis]|nr:hypothetical protein COE24_07570 [Bacillus thuringiensis]